MGLTWSDFKKIGPGWAGQLLLWTKRIAGHKFYLNRPAELSFFLQTFREKAREERAIVLGLGDLHLLIKNLKFPSPSLIHEMAASVSHDSPKFLSATTVIAFSFNFFAIP